MISAHSRKVVTVAAVSLGGMYLILGLVFVICFILVNCGIIDFDLIFKNLNNSIGMLIIIFAITFLGLFTSILVIFSVRRDKSFLIIPWLAFHLLAAILMILSGIAFVLHFTINKKQFMRAALCLIPILTGLMFLFIWMKVYREMQKTKFKEKQCKILAKLKSTQRHPTINSSAKHAELYPPLKQTDAVENIYSQPYGDIEEAEHIKPKLSPQANKYPEPIDNLKPHNCVKNWQTKEDNVKYTKQNQFSGLSFNHQKMPQRKKRFETLEASIILGEELNNYGMGY